MLALKLLLVGVFLLAKSSSMLLNKKLICPYPSESSILPCTCQIQPEIVDRGTKKAEVRSYWGGVSTESVEQIAFLGTFQKELICNLNDSFSFALIAGAFKDDNKIHEVKITGKHDRNYFLTAEDLGRLNISVLVVEADHTNNQKIMEADALRSSAGSLSSLKVKKMNTPKVIENALVDDRLDFLNPVCPTLEELELVGVPISDLTTEDFAGCSRLMSLTLLDSNIRSLGTDVFKHLINTRTIKFSSLSKFLVQTGAFQNLDNLEYVVFDKASNHLDENSTLKKNNLTIISDGAFNSLPSLYRLTFEADVDLFDGVPFLGLNSLQAFRVLNGKQTILQKLFDAAPNLYGFHFGKKLEHLEDNAFEELPKLKYLNLDGNRLTTFSKAFQVLSEQSDFRGEIDLSNNNLESINEVFEKLPRGSINVEGNTKLSPLTIFKQVLASDKDIRVTTSDMTLECDCSMKWLANHPAKLRDLGHDWKCKNGWTLEYGLGRTLLDLVEQYDYDDYKDAGAYSGDIRRIKYHLDDLANKTILELACPHVEED